MNIRDYASEFCVFMFSQNVDLGSRLKFVCQLAQYENYFFTDIDELLERMRSSPAHILVIDFESLILKPADLLNQCMSISSEVRTIGLAQLAHHAVLKKFKSLNLSLVYNIEQTEVEEHVIDAIDCLCEGILRTYQNEQIYEELNDLKIAHQELQNILESERSSPTVRPYQSRIAMYKSASSKEDLINIFFSHTSTQSWIYFKYVENIKTFLCVTFAQVPEAWTEGLSYKLAAQDKDFVSQIIRGQLPDSFLAYLKSKIPSPRFKFMPLVIQNKLEGLLVTTQEINAEIAEDFSLMSLVYNQLVLESNPRVFDVEDPLTGFYNQQFYLRMLEGEVDRSKRTFSPVSIVKVAIDHFSELTVTLDQLSIDQLVKDVAMSLKNTSRVPDYLCRTDVNEFSIILTNCNRKGAAIRAERLRQAVQNDQIIVSGTKVSISQGISEYPSLTQTYLELNESARKALQFISQRGGDKICMAKPQSDHRPDFMVTS